MQRLVQLALDLFDPPGPQERAAGASPTVAGSPAEKIKPKLPVALVDKAQAAPETVANNAPPTAAPAPALASLLSPAEFRHPQANREVLLGDAVVAYALQRVRRRSIGFTVGADGLAVRAPSWVTLQAVEAALREKSGWILRKLDEARARQQRSEGGRIAWAHGAQLPYLGEPLTVVLDPTHGFTGQGGALHPASEGATGASLRIGLPHSASPAQIRDAVQAWLMRDALRHFTARLDHFAPLLGVRWTRLRLSSAQTRWGSAKADGSIRLNWRLLHYRPAIIDYVVVHELAHLRVMDHSPRFWGTVATVVPDYPVLRHALREQPAPLWE
ncbi:MULTISPECIES: M48 family metallopeptidase [unclassified Acidovorax]|uniref:M48 family metallopeptidase n=1 Tax=unclassified Acidovorax TaxID=2684926 RepID=UPI000B3F7A70|nr:MULTISPECIES: SprT family zinc-dependent metalloprotease [unclassified Acidovorax]